MARTVFIAEDEELGETFGDGLWLEWGADQLDTLIADLTAAERRGAGGWTSYGSLSLHAVLHVDAPTAARAAEAALERVELPPGWRAEPTAEPLDEGGPDPSS